MNDQDHGIWYKSSMTPPTVNANKILSPMTIQGHYFLILWTIRHILMTRGWPGGGDHSHHGSGSHGARGQLVSPGQLGHPSPASFKTGCGACALAIITKPVTVICQNITKSSLWMSRRKITNVDFDRSYLYWLKPHNLMTCCYLLSGRLMIMTHCEPHHQR